MIQNKNFNMYNFTKIRAKEINENNSLAKEEAIIMKNAFIKQGNEKHGIEMSANYSTAVLIEKMFDLVVEEYKKLE